VYTSGDEAELFLNGSSLGRKKKEPLHYRLRWDDVKYQPGELRVVAYKDGRHWAEDVVKSTGPATKVLLKADRTVIQSDGSDLAFVTVMIADKDGMMVPRSQDLVRFEIEGPGEIVAVDNGNATSHESFKAKECRAYNGLCLVVRSRSQPGVIISSTQYGAAAQVRLRSRPLAPREAESVFLGTKTQRR
jgi:beta-galactosidase